MATRTVKCDSGNDLKLQNNGGTGSVTITDAGDLTIDSPADIILDAEGADITLKDGGTAFGSLKQASGHLVIQPTSSKEIILNDQGGTASLTVDTSSQNVSINNGNLVMGTAGKGIDFAAQTVSSATGTTPDTSAGDEVLDHYETGSWTGVLRQSAHPYYEMTMSSNTGYYTKIGNLVTVSGYFQTSSLGSPAASGDIQLNGLPFTIANNAAAYTSGIAGYAGNLNITAGHTVSYMGNINNTFFSLQVGDVTTGTSYMQASEWSADGIMIIGFTYRAA